MGAETPRERSLSEITPEMLRAASADLLALVDERLPERIYRGQGYWPIGGTALIAEMAGTVTSITDLAATDRTNDVLVLIRLLYEQVVTFCWVAIDPPRHLPRWTDEAFVQRLRLHNDARQFGITLLSDEQVENARKLSGLPKLLERAAEVDDYWPALIPGFRSHPSDGPMHLLTMRGLYVGIYRLASRVAHAQVDSIDPFVDLTR